ncbi:MAG TPA: branched-chain amino acid ABC transporter permease [Trinickia sp.]
MNSKLTSDALDVSVPRRSLRNSLHRYRFLLLAALVVCLLPMTMRSGSLATEVLVYALAALGCNLLLGHTGLLSFGQGIFFGLGSYSAGLILTKSGLQVPAALLGAIVVGAVAAAVVGWFSIRQRGAYFVMLTLAFGQMFYFLAYTTPDLTGGDNGLLDIARPALSIFGQPLVSIASPWQYYAFVAALFLIAFWLMLRVSHSVFGRTLLAIRDNEARAAAVGYNVRRFKLAAFVVSGAVTGLAGALHAMMTGIAPLSNIDYHTSEMILVMTVIGGTSNLFSSVLGAAFYVLFADWLATLWPRWLLLLGLVLIAVSLFMQRGLWGLGERICRAVKRDEGESA